MVEGERGNRERGREYSEIQLIKRERDSARAEENRKISEARYNRRYKEILAEGSIPRYLMRGNLEKTNLEEGVRVLARLRCGNMEEWNKYWLEEGERSCSFCNKDRDCFKHYIEDCREIKNWFSTLGERKEEVWEKIWSEDLDKKKGEVLVRIWKEKEKIKRVKEDRNIEENRIRERIRDGVIRDEIGGERS